ncbi:MAG TPA: tRNA-specific adenosine deaminase [Bacteroidales bacterium]|nr:tRNA-specific adenosine deaminase [Bacteroidales bacterium]HQN98433.1 nucleoside deaminase [Bacteroidales bacterium]HQQ02589.1 nucleoside deaminase [Bacteroidales bacterium]
MEEQLIQEVIELALLNVKEGKGGPFAAMIVKDGKVIVRATNTVTSSNDPTAHAEVNAIREACKILNTFQLSDCELYTSCEPCPMCFGAIYWARLKKVYFAARQEDAAQAGFDDSFIYQQLHLPHLQRNIPFIRLNHPKYRKPFELWNLTLEKVKY